MKRLAVLALLALCLLSACSDVLPAPPERDGSGSASREERERDDRKKEKEGEDGGRPEGSDSAPDESAGGDSGENSAFFAQLSGEFMFSSGAGAWATVLSIGPDGSFSGYYFDSDMGDSGDGYPNGTMYHCEFQGKLSQPQKVNDYTYSTNVIRLDMDGVPGDVSYEDGVRQIYSEPYGLDGADEILIYCPNAPVAELPEAFTGWVTWDLGSASGDTLNFYGLYEVNGERGFSGYGW